MISTICLAMVLYTEARGEPIEGQLAVAEVVLNRTERGAHPFSVCAVTLQANQFAKPQRPTDVAAWNTALLLSKAILEDPEGVLPGTDATFFHTLNVHPNWVEEMRPVARIGNHIFYSEKST